MTDMGDIYTPDDYEQTRLEHLLLQEGVRFKGMSFFSTKTWRAWVVGIVAVVFMLVIGFQLGLLS